MATPSIIAPGEGRLGGNGVTPPPKKTVKKPVKKALDFTPDLTPKAKPDPILSKHGVYDTPDVVAQKVKAIKAAHQAHFGTPATAGHVYDVVKANIPIEDVSKLYDAIPRNKREARIRSIPAPSPDTQDAASGYTGVDPNEIDHRLRFVNTAYLFRTGKNLDPKLAKELADSQTPLAELRDTINLMPRNPKPQDVQISLNPMRAEALNTAPATEAVKFLRAVAVKDASAEKIRTDIMGQELQAQGIQGEQFTATVKDLPRQLEAQAKGLAVGLPVLAWKENSTFYKGVRTGNFDPFLKTNKELYDTTLMSLADMFHNPRENVLNWALMIAGAAGVAEKAGLAGGALLKGKPGLATRRLLSTPDRGTSALRYGGRFDERGNYIPGTGVEVESQLSGNPLGAIFQDAYRSYRQAGADRRFQERQIPGAAARNNVTENNFVKGTFSFENKIRRELERKNRAELIFSTQGMKDIQRAAGWSESHKSAFKKVPKRALRGLKLGENMAIIVESFGLSGSFAEKVAQVSAMYDRQIALGLASEKSVSAVKSALKLAEEAMVDPRPRYLQALEYVRAGSAEAERIKQTRGLGTEAAARRRGAPARQIAGQVGSRREARSELIALRRNLANGVGNKAAIEDRIAFLKSEINRVPDNIGRLQTSLAKVEARLKNDLPPDEMAALTAKADALRIRLDESVAAYAKQADAAPTDAFYTPLISAERNKLNVQNPDRGMRQSVLGLPNKTQRNLFPEIYHEFTGSYFRAGNFRFDAANLVAQDLGRTIRATMVLDQYQTLIKAATKTKKSEWDVAIRKPDTDKWPTQHREIFTRTDQGELTQGDVAILSKAEHDELVKTIFPDEKVVPPDEILYVDSRLLGAEARQMPGNTAGKQWGERINAPFRNIALYARPAYFANLAGSAAMALVYQGPLAPINFAKTLLFSKKLYGEEVRQLIYDTVGAGKTNSFIDERLNSKLTRNVAHAWNVVTDRDMRAASLVYYLNKKGLNDAQIKELGQKVRAGDPDARATWMDARDKAQKSAVQFDNLTVFEREALRHVIFLYPWMRGSAVWSLRTLAERPLSSLVMSEIGLDKSPQEDKFLEQVPKWFKKSGYVPLWWDDQGNPTVVNVQGISTFSTLGSLISLNPQDFNSPALEMMISTFTGKDSFGNDYPGKDDNLRFFRNFYYAAIQLAGSLPQVRNVKPVKEAFSMLPGSDIFVSDPVTHEKIPLDISDREAFSHNIQKYLKQAAFTPGYFGGLGMWITGASFTPREANADKLAAQWYKNLPRDQQIDIQHKWNLMILDEQGKFMGRPVTKEIKDLVGFAYDMNKYVVAKQAEGEGQTAAEVTNLQLAWMHDNNKITDAEYKNQLKLVKQAGKIQDDAFWSQFQAAIFTKFHDPEQRLQKWDADVRAGWALTKPDVLQVRLNVLKNDHVLEGVDSVKGLSHDDLVQYGRRVAQYKQDYNDRQLEVDRTTDPTEKSIKQAVFEQWKEKHDTPVVVNGKKLPSVVRAKYSEELDPTVRDKTIDAAATKSWGELSRLEKQLVGRSGKGTQGWSFMDAEIRKILAKQPPGKREHAAWMDEQAAKQIDKNYHPGFYEDWKFAQKPLGERLKELDPIKESNRNDKKVWDYVLADAANYSKYIAATDANGKAVYKAGWLRDAWHDRATALTEWAKGEGFDGFQRFGPDIFYKLVDK